MIQSPGQNEFKTKLVLNMAIDENLQKSTNHQ